MQSLETKVFKDFPKVGTFVPNDGSSKMVRPRLIKTNAKLNLFLMWILSIKTETRHQVDASK